VIPLTIAQKSQLKLDRKLQVWRYGVSHSELEIMSNKDDNHQTRVVLFFKGVRSINLDMVFYCRSIEIRQLDKYTNKYIFQADVSQFEITALAFFYGVDEMDWNSPCETFERIEG